MTRRHTRAARGDGVSVPRHARDALRASKDATECVRPDVPGPAIQPADPQYGALVARVRAGDTGAIDELLERAMGIALRYSTAVCGRRPDREDAVQEALLQTFRHAHRIREPRAFRAWLYRTVKNACLVGRRKSRAAATTSFDRENSRIEPIHQALPPDDLLTAREAQGRVRAALASIPASYREAVFLRDLEGLSTREVAKILGITEANVKVRLHRAHARLRHVLS